MHSPCDKVYPHVCTSSIKALNCVVIVKWVEEKESYLGIVLWWAKGIKQNGNKYGQRSPDSLAGLVASTHHLFEVKLINTSLTEEASIIVDHHEKMMHGHVWLLSLPIVECNSSTRANKFHPHGILVTILCMNEKLECIEKEEDAHQSECWWEQISYSEVFLGVKVEAWEKPNCEKGQLKKNDISVISLIIRDFARSSNGPCKEWISQH